MSTEHNLNVALRLAEAGIYVFPAQLNWEEKKYKLPDGSYAGGYKKKPAIKDWQRDASTDPEQIKRWWSHKHCPEAVPGIEMGRSGLFAIDPDRKPGQPDGVKAFKDLRNGRELPPHAVTQTASGGLHLIFAQPSSSMTLTNSMGDFPKECGEVRGKGGWIVAPGAKALDVHAGEWRSVGKVDLADAYTAGAIAPPPQWLLDIIRPPRKQRNKKSRQPNEAPDIELIRGALRHIPANCDYIQWFTVCCALKSLGDIGKMLFDEWAATTTDEAQYSDDGQQRQWDAVKPAEEMDRPGTGLGTLFKLAESCGWQDPRKKKKTNGAAKPEPPKPDVDPGPLAALLDDLHAFIGRFVCYPSSAAHDAHALWIAHTHCMNAWDTTPRIAFLSPEVESGKTRALEISELLVQNPVCSVNVSPAYLFRRVSAEPLPTILFDEIDTIFGEKAKDHEEVRGLLNAGYRRGATAGRCVGPNQDPTDFPAYAALAMAGLGWLPDSLLSRAIIIRMRRRAAHETVTPYRRRVFAAEGGKLHDRLAAWGASAEQEMAEARPTFPAGIEDRKADIWEALLAIADAAGSHWPARARAAAVDIVRAANEKEPSLGIKLLADLQEIFEGHENMFTKVILGALCALPESPWNDLRGKPINDRELATRLGAYGIKSKQMRVGEFTAKGYSRADLHDAWERYLKEPPPRAQGWEGETSETCETAREDYTSESTEHDREADRTDFEAGEADNGNGGAGVSHVSHVSPLRAREGEVSPRSESEPVCEQCGVPGNDAYGALINAGVDGSAGKFHGRCWTERRTQGPRRPPPAPEPASPPPADDGLDIPPNLRRY